MFFRDEEAEFGEIKELARSKWQRHNSNPGSLDLPLPLAPISLSTCKLIPYPDELGILTGTLSQVFPSEVGYPKLLVID